ncbi:MAG: kelch repeat-containing protein [Gallionella sp.]|nr:hypothetical protein [Gallionella sp.]
MQKPNSFHPKSRFNIGLFALITSLLAGCGGGTGDTTGSGAATYKVGGFIIGLDTPNAKTIDLQLTVPSTPAEVLTVNANGTFTFVNKVNNGASYQLSITQPTGQNCTFTYGAGSVINADVTNMNVICGPAAVGSFVANTALMPTPVNANATTLLPNGKVLVIDNGMTAQNTTPQLYDPATDTWSATGTMPFAFDMGLTSTLLPNGKVLVVGPSGNSNGPGPAQLYDYVTNTWVAAPSSPTFHNRHTATLLPDGTVLVAGGGSGGLGSVDAEIYTPSNTGGSWASVGSMIKIRGGHNATVLQNGMVLMTGETTTLTNNPEQSELYNPVSKTFNVPQSTGIIRSGARATMLSDGRVLLAGGQDMTGPVAGVEIYNPTTNSWTISGGTRTTALSGSTFTLLPSGKVLAAGGTQGAGGCMCGLNTAELFDPVTGTWTATGNMVVGRSGAAATLLPNGKVLFTGGYQDSNAWTTANTELYW